MAFCHCLCAINHKGQLGICTSKATTTLRFSNFPNDSPLSTLEYVDVQMCESCRLTTLAQRQEKEATGG